MDDLSNLPPPPEPERHEFRGELLAGQLTVVAMSLGRLTITNETVAIGSPSFRVTATRVTVGSIVCDRRSRRIRITLRDGQRSKWFRGPQFERQTDALARCEWPITWK